MIINLIVHGNPKVDRCPPKVPACGELHPPGTERSTFSSPPIARSSPSSHLQGLDDFVPTASWWAETPEAVLSDNWVETKLKVRWLEISSLEESYVEVSFFCFLFFYLKKKSCKQKERDTWT